MAEKQSQDRRYDKAAARLAAAAAELETRAHNAQARLTLLDEALNDRDESRRKAIMLGEDLSRAQELTQSQGDDIAALRKQVASQGREIGALKVRQAALMRDRRETGYRLDSLIEEIGAILESED